MILFYPESAHTNEDNIIALLVYLWCITFFIWLSIIMLKVDGLYFLPCNGGFAKIESEKQIKLQNY